MWAYTNETCTIQIINIINYSFHEHIVCNASYRDVNFHVCKLLSLEDRFRNLLQLALACS